MDTIDFDGLQCLFYVAGFQGPDFAEYRTRLLRMLDQSEKITLKDLTAECQFIKSYKEDSRMLEGERTSTIRRRSSSNSNGKQAKPMHFTPDQTRRKRCHSVVQPTTPCHNRQIRRVIAALKKDDHPHLDVTINGHPTQLLFDMGAKITIVSESKWKLFGKPRLQKTDVIGFAANGAPLKIRGRFDAEFAVSNSSGEQCFGHGTCFVTGDDSIVLGMPWIRQLRDLYKAIKKYQIHRSLSTTSPTFAMPSLPN
ncbi:hypothetical protein ANCDUO_23876 [Ancylostoma duodenale]|uniref:Peptidase A2 domain-containing protein n=1 Tax=Ancylostoma duodenale TaxID=51022 RepID=A0A0C2FH54_9BILA|nr:hypothetical protein ANCDUO_23876 [Ancylostoma duodenale]